MLTELNVMIEYEAQVQDDYDDDDDDDEDDEMMTAFECSWQTAHNDDSYECKNLSAIVQNCLS